MASKPQTEVMVAEESSASLLHVNREPVPGRNILRLYLLWSHRQLLFRVGVIGLCLSIAAAFLIPKRYESVTRLMPPDQASPGSMMLAALTGGMGAKSGGGSSQLGSLAGDLLGLKSSGDLFVGVLQSRSVEDDLINKFDLRRLYHDRVIEDARKDLERKTEISSDRKSGIISIQVTDHDPLRAAAMAQEYVAQLNRVVVSLNTSSAGREREFLEQRLVEVKQDLESAEKRFSEFASRNTAIDVPAQGKAMIEAAAALEGQIIATQTELEGLRQIYTDKNVRVRSAEARADELRRQLEKVGGTASGTATSRADSNDAIPAIRQLPILGVPYADLYRETKVEEAVFETLTEEYELAKVEEAKETPSVKVLDPPDIPEKKSFPPRTIIIMLGTLLSIGLAATYVFSKTLWDLTPTDDPAKVFTQEVAMSVRNRFSRTVSKSGLQALRTNSTRKSERGRSIDSG